MRISHEHKFAFLAVPRTGSTTVRSVLEPHSDIGGPRNARAMRKPPYSRHTMPRELKAFFDRQGWDWFRYHRFCVVRNPFDRVVSLYHHRLQQNARRDRNSGLWHWAKRQVRKALDRNLTFTEFVERYNPQKRLLMPVCDFVRDADGRFLVDDFLHFERLADDLAAYLARLGVSLDPAAVPKLNDSPTRQPYSDYYDSHTRAIVKSIYACDFERFGYDPHTLSLTSQHQENLP